MSAPVSIVSLLTDFGLTDPYVGIMKAVLLREAPKLQVVDVSHQVPPQDVTVAAFWIARAFSWFPAGTVHLCVVDPGVGSERAPIAVELGTHRFVAPDNGLLSEVLATSSGSRTHRIDPRALGLFVQSHTFHGRDVFAPVAARLAAGRLNVADVGPEHRPLVHARRVPNRDVNGVSGTILFADHFGNLVSDVPAELVDVANDRVHAGGRELRIVRTYQHAGPDECVGVLSSFGTLEIAQREGNAAATLGLARGARVRVGLPS